MQQGAVAGDRGKADRRAVELGELHLDAGDARCLALTVGGDVGEAPQHEVGSVVGGQRIDRELQRAARAGARQNAADGKFLGEGFAALGGARQAEQRRTRRRIAGEELLQGDEAITLAAPDHPLEGGVGVHRLAVAARDQHADIETVGGSLDHIGERRALTDANVAGRVGEEEEQPDGRQGDQHGDEHRRADAAGDDAKGDARADDDRADGRQIGGEPLQRRDRVEGRGRQLDCVVLAHTQGGYLILSLGGVRRRHGRCTLIRITHNKLRTGGNRRA